MDDDQSNFHGQDNDSNQLFSEPHHREGEQAAESEEGGQVFGVLGLDGLFGDSPLID